MNITIVDDDICEEDEYFSVHLNSADDCVTIEPDYSYKHIAIIDDDGKFDDLLCVARYYIFKKFGLQKQNLVGMEWSSILN